MNAIKSLLAATDFSYDATQAVARGAHIACEQQAPLTLLHVIRGPSLELLRENFSHPAEMEAALVAESRRSLEQACAKIAGQYHVSVTSEVRIGVVLAEILAAAEPVDLLVMGARGTSPVRDLIIGSTSERLLGKSRCPALIVKRAAQGPYKRVIVPVDFSRFSGSVLMAAQRVAPDAKIYICHAFDVPFEGRLRIAGASDDDISKYRTQVREQALADIRDLAVRCKMKSPQSYLPVVARGDTSWVILDKESEYEADLIVIGKQGNSLVGDFLLGSVTRHIVADAKCDVLVVNREV